MADYQAHTDIDASAADVFDYVSDIANLPRYFTRMTAAEPGDGNEVHVTADLGERTVEGDAWFRVDPDDRILTWGSEGPNNYHGRLAVSERGLGASVSVTLSTERVAGPEIQHGLEQTVANIRNQCGSDRDT